MNKQFVNKLRLDESNFKTLIENKQKIGAFSVFKSTFLGQLWNMVKANWLTLLFCLPLVAWLVLSMIQQANIDSKIDYSGNIGLGWPGNNYSFEMGLTHDFYLAMQRALIMIPCIIVACVGLAGTFNVIKYNAWGMQIKIIKTFFKGIKNSFIPFILMGLLIGICYVLITFTSHVFDVYSLGLALKIVCLIAACILLLFVVMLCVYVFPQAVMFDLTIWAMLKNSFVLIRKFIIQSLLIAIVGSISGLLLLLSFQSLLQMIAMMVFFMMAFSYTACVFTCYTHHVFEVVDAIRKDNTPIEVLPTQTNVGSKKKKQKQAYQNPKKGKK